MAKRTFAVIGLGRFGAAMATTLSQLGHEVIGIDGSDDRVNALADQVSQTMKLDATDERALRASGIQDVDVAVVSIGENIEASLLVVTLVKELGIENIVAKAVSPLHGRILEKLGVTRVVFPEREMAMRVAHSLVIPNVLDYIELSGDFSIVGQKFPGRPAPMRVLPLTMRPSASIQRTRTPGSRPARSQKRSASRSPTPRSEARTTSLASGVRSRGADVLRPASSITTE